MSAQVPAVSQARFFRFEPSFKGEACARLIHTGPLEVNRVSGLLGNYSCVLVGPGRQVRPEDPSDSYADSCVARGRNSVNAAANLGRGLSLPPSFIRA